MSEQIPELTALADAVQALINVTSDEPLLLSQAVVIYEAATFDDAGNAAQVIRYACPTDNFSPSGALGLLDAGRYYLRRDILGDE